MLNKQGPGKIDWTDWTWNPISGCKHNCHYCYIKAMDQRFKSEMMEPAWHPARLIDIKSKKIKPGDKIFVGSSGDMWGEWVYYKTINNVLDIAMLYPDYIFQFLTKNPTRYNDFYLKDFDNCWFGTTVDGTDKTQMNLSMLLLSTPSNVVRFASFEPLIKPVDIDDMYMDFLDWIIIGADSTPGADKPDIAWADHLINLARRFNVPVFVKDNYRYPIRIKEFPDFKKKGD